MVGYQLFYNLPIHPEGAKMFQKIVLFVFGVLFCQSVLAEEGDMFGQVFIVSHTGWETFSQELYIEREVTDGISIFGNVYSDGDVSELLLGVAKTLGDVQVGLGGGVSRYDDTLHPIVLPWVWYGDDHYTAYFEAEYYFGGEEDPWWYRGYGHRTIGSTLFFAGVYGEKDVGVGPLIGWGPTEQPEIFGAVPVLGTSDAGVILQLELSWD